MPSDNINLERSDTTEGPTDVILSSEKSDYESTVPIELLKSTRENFMTWKDYDY